MKGDYKITELKQDLMFEVSLSHEILNEKVILYHPSIKILCLSTLVSCRIFYISTFLRISVY